MTRRIDAPVRVVLDRSGTKPAAFLWERRCYRVRRVEACWKQMGSWWDGEGERTCFRVAVEAAGIYELAHDHETGQWFLMGVLD